MERIWFFGGFERCHKFFFFFFFFFCGWEVVKVSYSSVNYMYRATGFFSVFS